MRSPSPLPHGPATVGEILDAHVLERPGQEALVDGRRRLTYAELHAVVDDVAAGLSRLGVDRTGAVAISLTNSVDIVVGFLACMRLGALFVGVHPALAPVEKARLLADSGADVLITSVALADALATQPIDAIRVAIDLDDDGIFALAESPGTPRPGPDPFAPAAYAYTSGTTGMPKAAIHDQHHMLLPAGVILHHRLGGRGERIGVHLPLTTLNVEILGPVLAFLGGGTCICLGTHHPGELADLVARERIDHLATSPAVAHDLVEHPDVERHQLQGLRLGVGGVACPESLRAAYREKFGREFTTGYGLTEAPTSVAQETERVHHRAGASGVAMAHVEIEIVDDDGRVLAPGHTGEVTVVPARAGPWAGCWTGMHGYHGRPQETARALGGNRLHTGDTGWLDPSGYLHVADRRSEVINRGGSKVSPAEVERVLRDHPAVADCIVLGRADDRLGETVAAAVQVRAGWNVSAADLATHCGDSLARFKVPGTFAVVAELPRNPMGKVIRDDVLALFEPPTDEG